MATKQFAVSETIDAPVESVFGVASNLHEWVDSFTGITAIDVQTEGPVGVGTRFSETRVIMGKSQTEQMEFTEFDPPNGYVLSSTSCGTFYESKMSFHPVSRGTRVELLIEATPMTLFAKVLLPVMTPLMKKMMMKCLSEDLADLKNTCEGGVTPGVAAEGGVATA